MTDITDFKVNDVVGYCPSCGHELIIRKGKYGLFIGCSNFPDCRRTYKYDRFKVRDEIIELKQVEETDNFATLKMIRDTTESSRVRSKAETKIIKNHYCECGERVSNGGIYRTTPDYPHYLKEYTCPHCGTYVITETRDYASFCRMGRLEHHPEDEAIMGGYWL